MAAPGPKAVLRGSTLPARISSIAGNKHFRGEERYEERENEEDTAAAALVRRSRNHWKGTMIRWKDLSPSLMEMTHYSAYYIFPNNGEEGGGKDTVRNGPLMAFLF